MPAFLIPDSMRIDESSRTEPSMAAIVMLGSLIAVGSVADAAVRGRSREWA